MFPSHDQMAGILNNTYRYVQNNLGKVLDDYSNLRSEILNIQTSSDLPTSCKNILESVLGLLSSSSSIGEIQKFQDNNKNLQDCLDELKKCKQYVKDYEKRYVGTHNANVNMRNKIIKLTQEINQLKSKLNESNQLATTNVKNQLGSEAANKMSEYFKEQKEEQEQKQETEETISDV